MSKLEWTEQKFISELIKLSLYKYSFGIPAKIIKVHADKLQVDVQPQIMQKHLATNTDIEAPIIKNVPFKFLHGGNTLMTFPLAIGDEGWLSFSHVDISKWKKYGGVQPIASNRLLNINDAVFFPGFCSEASVPTGYDANNIIISYNNKKITISDGIINAPDYTINCKAINVTNNVVIGGTLSVALGIVCNALITALGFIMSASGLNLANHAHMVGTIKTGEPIE